MEGAYILIGLVASAILQVLIEKLLRRWIPEPTTLPRVVAILLAIIAFVFLAAAPYMAQLEPQPAERPSPAPMPTAMPTRTVADATASITIPQNGSAVGERVISRGVVSGLTPGQRAFLCIKSQAFSRKIYPQGEILPDQIGQWTLESKYHSVGYSYETFVVATSSPEAAEMLADGYYRTNGMDDLPGDTIIISPVIVVTRQ